MGKTKRFVALFMVVLLGVLAGGSTAEAKKKKKVYRTSIVEDELVIIGGADDVSRVGGYIASSSRCLGGRTILVGVGPSEQADHLLVAVTETDADGFFDTGTFDGGPEDDDQDFVIQVPAKKLNKKKVCGAAIFHFTFA